ncbi:MAG TPA: glycosyltransferase [Candidatus Udaeobacter sp.]|nr:glycosyltransferase [Candidatus Udaeobacter sp.]
MSPIKISLIIPTYNEAKNLSILIEEIWGIINKEKIDLEFIIVDDNSPDGTGNVAEELKKNYPIKVIHRSGKLGLGSAVREGFKLSDRPYVGVMDADLSHNPVILNDLILSLLDNNIAIGGRFSEGSSVEDWKWWRKLVSKVGVFFARKLTGIKDPLSGYFFLNKNVISGINLKTKGYKILLEVLIKGNYTKVKELPYNFRVRKFSSSKLNYMEYMLFFGQLFKYSLLRIFKYFRLNKDKTYFISLIALSLILLFYRISSRTFWMDETAVLEYMYHSPNPLNFLIEYFRVPDNHPPLYYFLVILLYRIFPFGELGIRLVSVLSGLGITVTVYYFSLLLFKDKALARWGMFLTSISSYFLLISQMARYHSLAALLTLLSLYYFCKMALVGYERKLFIKFLLFSVLVGYTDLPHFVYLIFIINICYFYLFLTKNKVLSLSKWLAGQAGVAVSFLPIIYLFYLRIFIQNDKGFEKASLLGKSFINLAADFLMHFYAYFFGENILPWNFAPFIAGALVMVVLLFVLIKKLCKQNLEFYLLFYLFLMSVILNVIFLNHADPRYNFIVYPKYVFVAFPLFIILITRLTFEIKGFYKYLIMLMLILVQAAGLFNFYQRQNYFNGSYFNDFTEYQFVQNNSKANDYLIINGDMNIGNYNFYKDKYFGKLTAIPLDKLPNLLEGKKRDLRVWFFSTGSDGDSAYDSMAAADKIPEGFKIIDQHQSVPTDPILLKLKQKIIGRQSYNYKYSVYLLTNK